MEIAVEDIACNDIVYYRLRSQDAPVDPDREWKGEVLSVFLVTDWTVFFLVVASLEPGYDHMIELVYPWQITRLEKGDERGGAGTPAPPPFRLYEDLTLTPCHPLYSEQERKRET